MPPYKSTKVRPIAINMSKEEEKEELAEDDELEGPVMNRSCRDVPCCMLFIIFMIGMIAVAGMALQQGSPYSLFYGVDSWGNVCNDLNPNQDLRGLKKSFRFDAAAHFMSLLPGVNATVLAQFGGQSIVTCVKHCPNDTLATPEDADAYQNATKVNYCFYNVTSFANDTSKCAGLPILPQTSLMNRCVPSVYITTLTQAASGVLSSVAASTVGPDFIQRVVQDIETAQMEILILCGVAILSSLLLVFLMQLLAAVLIWSLVVFIGGSGIAATAYSWYTWHELNQVYQNLTDQLHTTTSDEEVRLWMAYAIMASVVTAIVLLMLLFLRKRIGLVVQLFKEAGKAIRRIPMLLIQPIWTLIFLASCVTALIVIGLYVETTGKASLDDKGFVEYEKDEVWQVLRWYHIFGALWLTAFIFACQDVVVAGAVATWYFNSNKPSLGWPILASSWRLFRYHMGSVAFGSFIIALIRFIRMVLAYIQKQTKGRTGKLASYIMKCVQCCLYCFEKFIAYLNRNAYIEIAIYGHSFCTAAKKAFMLIVANVLRVAAINSIGDFVLFLGKIVPVGLVIIAGMELLKDRNDIGMTMIPITLCALFAFAVGHVFFGVYEMVIDTIFLCFCEDCEQNDGVDKPYFMSKGLMTYLDKSEKVNLRRKRSVKKDKGKEGTDTGKQEDTSAAKADDKAAEKTETTEAPKPAEKPPDIKDVQEDEF